MNFDSVEFFGKFRGSRIRVTFRATKKAKHFNVEVAFRSHSFEWHNFRVEPTQSNATIFIDTALRMFGEKKVA
jgi:hypothetical protein